MTKNPLLWILLASLAVIVLVVLTAKSLKIDKSNIERYHPAEGYSGVWTVWFDNGQKRLAAEYNNGKKHGASERWYEDGSKRSLHTYKEGVLHGFFAQWARGGLLIAKGSYLDGKPHDGFFAVAYGIERTGQSLFIDDCEFIDRNRAWMVQEYKDGKPFGIPQHYGHVFHR